MGTKRLKIKIANKKLTLGVVAGAFLLIAGAAALLLPPTDKKVVHNQQDQQDTTAVLSEQEQQLQVKSLWPTEKAELQGVQEFKAEVTGAPEDDYELYWSVNDGPLNEMPSDEAATTHIAKVDVSAWSVHYPHEVAYVATTPEGEELERLSVEVNVKAKVDPVVAGAQAKPKAIPALPPVGGGKVAGLALYADPNSRAAKQANEWRASRPGDAALMDKIAGQSQGKWLNGNASDGVIAGNYAAAAAAAGKLPVFVLYAIPQRNCSGNSGGGLANYDAYAAWVQQVANGISGKRALVVLEPDALPCAGNAAVNQEQRYRSMSKAVDILKANPGTSVYIDAGHAKWVGADEMAGRLVKANMAKANGFSLNVSNFQATDVSIAYGKTLSAKLSGRHFVIDTGRNGLGPSPGNEWCNPPGRAAGLRPTTVTGHSLVDAYLWVKVLGESDGNWGGCSGGPGPGQWWADYALGLIQRASW